MKKFLTLALALVMALALAAPAMAFVEFEYSVDSDFDLDFYLVDYDTHSGLFNSTGVFTELPAADRGYVTNEMVGAVVEVLVPAKHGGDKVSLTVSSEDVVLDYITFASKDNLKLENAATVAARVDNYVWDYTNDGRANKDELFLDNVVNTRKFLQNDSSKDVTAAWLVTGRVISDEASLTAKLFNQAANYNTKLATPAVGATTYAPYKIGDNKYQVALKAVAGANGKLGSYVYVITPESGNGEVRIYTDADFKTKAMVASSGMPSTVIDTTAAGTKHVYTIDFGTFASSWVTGASMTINGTKIEQDAADTAVANVVTKVQAALDANPGAGIWTAAASGTDAITVTAEVGGVLGGTTALTAGLPPVALSFTDFTTGISAATTTLGAYEYKLVPSATASGYYLVGRDGKLYDATWPTTPPTLAELDKMPAQGALVAASGVGISFLDDVLADFAMNPALVGNVLKPEYLGQYRQGNVIEEITIDIQPWQAYVTIPDIEVIDPPKTGDAATLAGFVMIVLAAAGVVVFKKVRA